MQICLVGAESSGAWPSPPLLKVVHQQGAQIRLEARHCDMDAGDPLGLITTVPECGP